MTAAEYRPEYGAPRPCENRGKRLGEFSFMSLHEHSEESVIGRGKAELADFRELVSGTEAEKLVRKYMRTENLRPDMPNLGIKNVTEELAEVGVELSERQVERLIQLLSDCHNNMRLWCLRGWSPTELARLLPPKAQPSLSFGSNMQKMFEDGTLDRDELVEDFKKMGVDVIE